MTQTTQTNTDTGAKLLHCEKAIGVLRASYEAATAGKWEPMERTAQVIASEQIIMTSEDWRAPDATHICQLHNLELARIERDEAELKAIRDALLTPEQEAAVWNADDVSRGPYGRPPRRAVPALDRHDRAVASLDRMYAMLTEVEVC